MSPFRRRDSDEKSPTGAAATPPPLGDQWFRPEEPAVPEPKGKGRNGNGTKGNGAKVAGRTRRGAVPAPASPSDDAPTESFTPPDWHDPDGDAGVPGSPGGGVPAGGSAGGPPDDGAGFAAAAAPKKKKKKKHRIQKTLWALLAMVAIAFGLVVVAYSRIAIPDPNKSALYQTSRVYYAGGQQEIGRFGDINRNSVTLDKVPKALRDAVLAAENRSFYSDNGVSPKGMARALWVNLHGGSTQGGSTITQQYVKNYYLTQDRTIKRKLREALLSIKIDREMSKDQILQDYLNTIYMGRGAYGVQAAAKAYFDKDVSKLNVGESAVIASIIRSPGRYDPSERTSLANLKVRWRYVVDSMVQTGALTPEQAKAVVFPTFPKEIKAQSRYGGQRGYILTAIRQELQARGLDKETIENGGLRIVTTLDPQAQQSALDAVNKEFPTFKNKGLRVGLAAVQPGTGRIIAMYGGKDFLAKSKYAQVNTATVPIQPGSGMKVFTLAAALENGYSLNSGFYGNSPLSLPGSKPVNNEFNQDYGGSVSLMKGLEQSINTVFVDATQHIGASKVRRAIVRAGIPNDAPGLDTNARITLGIASIRPTQMADAYATLCSGGIHAEQHMVERVFGPNGGEIPITKPNVSDKPVFEPWVVSDVIKAMENVVEHGTGTKAQRLGRPVAGKTGTHQDLTAWFNGCTPQLAASVVYFKNDGTDSLDGSAGMSTFFGGTYPTQTWTTFMKGALRGQPTVKFPVVHKTSDRPTVKPTDDPYNSFSGYDGVDPTVQPTVDSGVVPGPAFPSFDPGPSTFSPAPSAAPVPAPQPTTTTEPQVSPPPDNCTHDPNDPDPSRVYREDCAYPTDLPPDPTPTSAANRVPNSDQDLPGPDPR